MKYLKQFVYGVFFLGSGYVVSAQHQRITLVENSYVCKSCEVLHAGFNKQKLQDLIKNDSILQVAVKKISWAFTGKGDRFILQCENCKGRKTLGFMAVNADKPSSRSQGFGTYMDGGKGAGSLKGNDEFYKFEDLLAYMNDSTLIFDSVHLSTALLVNKDPEVFITLRATYSFSGKLIERIIPYDAEGQFFRINYKILFGNKLDRSTTDSIPVSLHYYSSDNEKVEVPGNFRLYFATTEEKGYLADLYAAYKRGFPEWTTEQIAKELGFVISDKYNNIQINNFITWLKSLP